MHALLLLVPVMERNENCFSIPVDKREAVIRWTFFFIVKHEA